MAWIRLDDQIAHHPKLTSAGLSSWLWVCCIGFSQKFLTDGFIPDNAIPSIASGIERPRTHIEKLVKVGLLDRVEGGLQVHDYLHYNDSAAVIKARRELDRVRKVSERSPNGVRAESERSPSAVLARAPASLPNPTLLRERENKKGGRSKKCFDGRFVVLPWMEQRLASTLGTDAEAFDLHAWYLTLNESIATTGAMDTEWPWLLKQLTREARTRGLILDSANTVAARVSAESASGNGHGRKLNVVADTPAERKKVNELEAKIDAYEHR